MVKKVNQPIVSVKRISQEGPRVYKELQSELESKFPEKYVAIDVESKDYYLGDTLHEALERARKRHKDKVFYAVKVGSPTLYTFTPISGASIVGTASAVI
jgi:hypothetical protein